jgi:pyruvate dehydrogenase E1 component
VNRRGLFAREAIADTFRTSASPRPSPGSSRRSGQHIELGIAEMNLFILLSALGLSHSIDGERLLPIGTLYDPFIARGLDALNYACYQDAASSRRDAVRHHARARGRRASVDRAAADRHGAGRAGAFEPAFVDELAVILRFALDYIQKDGDGEISERNWLRDETGGSVYLRLSTRPGRADRSAR